MIRFSGFVDEALASFEDQLRLARRAGLTHVELRRVGWRNAAALPPAVVDRVLSRLDAAGLGVACLATGLGKVGVHTPLEPQRDALRRAAALARRLGGVGVRTFAWRTDDPDADRATVAHHMFAFVDTARDEGVRLLLENEKGTWADTPERCLELVAASDGDLGLILDPANFVQVGAAGEGAWGGLLDHVRHVHAKDARADTGRVVPVGQGDADWPALARALTARDWDGFVSLEPHLGLAGRAGPVTATRWLRELDRVRALVAAAD